MRMRTAPQSTSIDVFLDGLVPCDGHQNVEILAKDEQAVGMRRRHSRTHREKRLHDMAAARLALVCHTPDIEPPHLHRVRT